MRMEKIIITTTIEDGIVTITDNLGNKSSNDFDPEITISDQIGTFIADHIEEFNIHDEIISEGAENADYNDGYFDDDDDDFDD
jgi:hypothetical protein